MPAEYAIVGYGVTDIGRVDEIDASIQRTTDDADRIGAVVVSPRAEHHGAETERADLNTGAAERTISHGMPSFA